MRKRVLAYIVLFVCLYTLVIFFIPLSFDWNNKNGEVKGTDAVVAFPGAQGFGANTPGGRGGRVIHVTNLNDSGSGSLREALQASGARIVVFDVSGTITLQNNITVRSPYLTIAGQTAGGDGITIRNGGIYLETHDVIIRNLRMRVGAESSGAGSERHGIGVYGDGSSNNYTAYNVIIDHCSLSWGTDENFDMWGGVKNVTMQWSIVSEALMHSIHPKGDHSMGMLFNEYTYDVSIHHNLFAHNYYRNPLIQGLGSAEVINNVVYNWGWEGTYFCNSEIGGPLYANVIGNKYVSGVDSKNRGIMIWDDVTNDSKVYVQGNEGPGREDVSTGAEADAVTQRKTGILSSTLATKASGMSAENVRTAYQNVLSSAGAIAPKRDAIDNRIVNDVKNKTGKVIDTPSQVGGWSSFSSVGSPQDSDRDGMPDSWESSHGLNANDSSDGNKTAPSGYTWIEEYINSLISSPNPQPTGSNPTTIPTATPTQSQTISKIINHNDATLSKLNLISTTDINSAKSKLHIAFGFTSHGSQIVTGMDGLVNFKGSNYAYKSGGGSGYLDLRGKSYELDSGAYDLGNPNRTAWVQATRNYLNSHKDINVMMWAWCGQVSDASSSDIANSYLANMNTLEREFPNVTFVYMTGHLDGTGINGNLNQRNNQIRDYCRNNGKWLYDYADIESFDQSGNEFLSKGANADCSYNSGNWCTSWQGSHTKGSQWYDCECAHSNAVNCNQKAYAAWSLWTKIAKAGTNPTSAPTQKPTSIPTPTGDYCYTCSSGKVRPIRNADANCDSNINELDFAVWLSEYQKKLVIKSDFNCNKLGQDLNDFSIWNESFMKLN